MTRIEWAYTPATSRALRVLSLVGAGALGSLFVCFGGALVFLAATSRGHAAGIGVYVALFVSLFGCLFAWLGSVEG
ncbi:hypothetical protein PNP85_11870 [Halobacterium salinarum]|uniref:hypothetical protein n=1 Tax=Halobacterium TaxID=2239 RepID=UPI0025521F2B|nr:hypothetical protein [Halobacterium salinarum]MDL0140200.1 hypothetical protein [Halobacterium salinarum]WJK63217.1 hypothetical protein QSJ49_08150 [Halobacterium salinarum]